MTSLSDLEVLVVDCQSTGASPKHGALMEIGWCRTRPRDAQEPEITSHLIALPPGGRIPMAVRRLTGISREDLVDGIAVERAMEALLAFAEGVEGARKPTVIHFARFEESWINALCASPPFDILCTHEIARRILPGLPRRGLRALAGYYGFSPELVRRSAGHVAATAFLWRHLAAELAARGVHDWHSLRAWLGETAPLSRKERTYPMDRDKRLALPDRPGVYRMLRTSGDVLYVGKAISLKKRVNSYFTKQRGYGERHLEMLSQARDIDVTVTETGLEAALLETEEIKRHRPPYNVQLRDEAREAWFASRDLDEAAVDADDRHNVGPLPSRYAMASYAALRALLVAGVAPTVPAMARALGMGQAFVPDAPVFQQGVDLFRARYGLGMLSHATLMTLSKRLLRLLRRGKLDEGEPREDDAWDPERVARHLERVVLAAGQLLRRARWLCLLAESTVAWQEPGAPARRMLSIERAHVVERAYVPPEAPLPAPPGAARSRRDRQQSFDIGAYNRLRILSTELKRITQESLDAEVRLSERVVIDGFFGSIGYSSSFDASRE